MRTAALALVLGCSLDVDYGGTSFRCGDGVCPSGFLCRQARCLRPAEADASVADAPPRVDAHDAGGLCDQARGAPDTNGCGVARDLSAGARQAGGVTVYGSTRGYQDHLNPSILVGCTGSPELGPDALYRVDVRAMDTLRVALTTTDWDAAVYLVDGCSRTAACLGGSDSLGVGITETFSRRAAASATYYVVVDASLAAASGCYALTVEIQ